MKLTKEQKIENCLIGLAMLDDLPRDSLVRNLCNWREGNFNEQKHVCGTAACFGGWVAVHPHFQNLGVYPATNRSMESMPGQPRTKHVQDMHKLSYELFGIYDAFNQAWNSNGRERDVIRRRLRSALNAISNLKDDQYDKPFEKNEWERPFDRGERC